VVQAGRVNLMCSGVEGRLATGVPLAGVAELPGAKPLLIGSARHYGAISPSQGFHASAAAVEHRPKANVRAGTKVHGLWY
jgi:hypothetical protein